MVKRSAQLLLLVSVWLGLGTLPAGKVDPGSSPLHLSQESLVNHEFVLEWLKRNHSTADLAGANRMFDSGVRAQKAGNWSRTAKAFGESALDYPSPRTLVNYADAFLHDIASVRARSGDSSAAKSDLTYALGLYQSAIAADKVVNTFTPSEMSDAIDAQTCIAAYLARETPSRVCRPVQIYTSKP